jgi:hypothetical protein
MSHWVFCPAFIADWRVDVADCASPFAEGLFSLARVLNIPVESIKNEPAIYREVLRHIRINLPCRMRLRPTFSPIGDISFRRILPRSGSPINRPMVSSSRRMNTNGSQILQYLILGRWLLPSMSLMICRSVQSVVSSALALCGARDCVTCQAQAP